MALTKEEALKAAAIADNYPTDHGYEWGHGPLAGIDSGDLGRCSVKVIEEYG